MTDVLQVGQHSVKVKNLNKVMFPEDGITKGEMIDYYLKVADAMLPHIKDRPITMIRYPSGIHSKRFWQKAIPQYFPDWIIRATMENKTGGSVTYPLCNDTASLLYMANQGTVTFHIWLSRVDRPDYPDKIVFDLDPPNEDFGLACRTAKAARELLEEELGLGTFVMTSGSKGLHVVVPLDRKADFDTIREFAKDAMEVLAARDPERLTTEQRKEARNDRLYLDPFRNSYAQTSVAPYSIRALPGAPVAAPLDWDELDCKTLTAQSLNIRNMLDRLANHGDPWADMWKKTYSIEDAYKRLAGEGNS